MQEALRSLQDRLAPAEEIFFTWLMRVFAAATLVGCAWIDDAPPLGLGALIIAIYVAVRVATTPETMNAAENASVTYPTRRDPPDLRATLVRVSSPSEHLTHLLLGGLVVAVRFRSAITCLSPIPNTTRPTRKKSRMGFTTPLSYRVGVPTRFG